MISTIIPIAITCAGFLTLVACAAATRNVRTGLQSALELWFAAGAIRLGASANLQSIATAAIILAVRQAVAARFFRRATR